MNRLPTNIQIRLLQALLTICLLSFTLEATEPVPDQTLLSSSETRDGDLILSDGPSEYVRLDASGETAAFQSEGSNLLSSDTDETLDIYLRSRSGLELISVSSNNSKGNRASYQPSLSGDGTQVVFTSDATNLVDLDGNNEPDVFLKDTNTGALTLISLARSGRVRSANGPSEQPEISGDGNWVVFCSKASNLLPAVVGAQDPFEFFHLYILDIDSNRLKLPLPRDRAGNFLELEADIAWPDIDSDGSFVVFETLSKLFFLNDDNENSDVILYDNSADTFELVGLDESDAPFANGSFRPRISSDGTHVAFEGIQADGIRRVYVRNLQRGTTILVSQDSFGVPADANSRLGEISADGNHITFETESSLSSRDTLRGPDVYLHTQSGRKTSLVSISPRDRLSTGSSSRSTVWPCSIDSAGTRIAFSSESNRLTSPGIVDSNSLRDIYRYQPLQNNTIKYPPANLFVLFDEERNVTRIQQVHKDGNLGRFQNLSRTPGGLFRDELNTTWFIDGESIRRVSSLLFNELLEPQRLPGEGSFQSLVAKKDRAFIARNNIVYAVDKDGKEALPPFRRLPTQSLETHLQIDASDQVWAAVSTAGEIQIFKLSFELELLYQFIVPLDDLPRSPNFEFALSPSGSLYFRTSTDLAKVSATGDLIWRRTLNPGGGLAVAHDDSVYVAVDTEILCLDARGVRTFRLDLLDLELIEKIDGREGLASKISLCGDGLVAVTVEGDDGVILVNSEKGSATKERGVTQLTTLPHDATGYSTASITDPSGDADDDTYTNLGELQSGENPFDSTLVLTRIPPVINLTGETTGFDVELQWQSPFRYCSIEVYRDGVLLDGDGESCGVDTLCFTDENLPGGVYLYQVRGIDDCRGDEGKNKLDGKNQKGLPPSQVSDFEEFLVVVGDQGNPEVCLLDLPFGLTPTAVSFSSDGSSALILQESGLLNLVTVPANADQSFTIDETIELPNDPFDSTLVTGCAFDPDNPNSRAFLLTEEGQIYTFNYLSETLIGDPIELADAPGLMRDDLELYDYSGLVVREGIFYTLQHARSPALIGPGVDCLIGYSGPEVVAAQLLGGPQGLFPNRQLNRVNGLSIRSEQGDIRKFLVGLGTQENSIGQIFDFTSRVFPDQSHTFGESEAGIDLSALGDSIVHDFDFNSDRNAVLVASTDAFDQGQICLLTATFPNTPSLTLDHSTGAWDDSHVVQLTVDYGNTEGDFNSHPFTIKIDGLAPEDLAPFNVSPNGIEVITQINLSSVDSPRARSISIHSNLGIRVSDFIQGFRRGDTNSDQVINLADAFPIIFHLFGGGPDDFEIPCIDALNFNDSTTLEGQTEIDLTDIVSLLEFLFLNGPPPPNPYLDFGLDQTVDSTECGDS